MKINLIGLVLFFSSTCCFAKSNIDITHVVLDLKFDLQKRHALGSATIFLTLLEASDSAYLDAGNLKIFEIQSDNLALSYTYAGGEETNNLCIALPKRQQAGAQICIRIRYATTHENRSDPYAIWGSFGKGLRFIEPTAVSPSKRKQIWSSGEPNSNKFWFPCKHDIKDIHTTEIIGTIEKPLLFISNGDLVSIKENEDNTRTFHYKTKRPFPNYLVSITAGEYADIQQQHRGIPIHTLGYPDEGDAVKATTVALPKMIQFLETKTGYAYPFNHYTQVAVQDYPFPGKVGQHNSCLISDNYIDDYGVHEDFKYLWDGVSVQALASQWFGNLLMPETWDHIWLNKAFAQYFAGLYTAHDNSLDEYLTYYLPFEQGNVFADWESGNIHPIVTDKYSDLSGFSSDSYATYRGALILHLLQFEMGEKKWWKSIQYYVKINAFKQVKTADFQNALEQVSGESYQWFFDQWIYKTGHPRFKVVQVFDSVNDELKISVSQIQNHEKEIEYEQPEFFSGKMEVEIDSVIVPIVIQPKFENKYTFSMHAPPGFINFNYRSRWICEIDYAQTTDSYLNQLAGSTDPLAKQSAVDELVLIYQDSTSTDELKEKIMLAFRAEITSELYWRYRLYVLGSLRKIDTPPYEKVTTDLLIDLIQTESSWLKASAITALGNSNDSSYVPIYLSALSDISDRVINAAAIALGKTKSDKVYSVLLNLEKHPSWKNQNRISALNGLSQLCDPRGADYALECLKDNHSPRWYLATPIWDYPFAAINTLIALNQTATAYEIVLERIKIALQFSDLNDLFQQIYLLNLLNDPRSQEAYDLIKTKYKSDIETLEAVVYFEGLFHENQNQ